MPFVSKISSLLFFLFFLISPFVSALPRLRKRADIDTDFNQCGQRDNYEVEGEPCGQIFRWAREDLRDGCYPVYPARIVYQCLTSAPFHEAVALRFLDYLTTTLQFQSTLAYLRDPPEGYQWPAIDVMDQLNIVKAKVLAGAYRREYDFEVDINNIISAIHDSHVDITFGILSPFSFGSLWEIVSVSRDGKELPKPYLREDITDAQNSGWSFTPSPIKTINGVDAVEFLKQFNTNYSSGNVEAHADYNQLFEHPAADIQLDYGIWSGQIEVYPGNGDNDLLDFVLENGTVIESEWWAELRNFQDPGPLETGGDLYNFFVLGLLPASYDSSDNFTNPETVGNNPNDTVQGTWWDESQGAYPRYPDVVQRNLSMLAGGVVTGYYLEDVSTGVLSIPSFTQFGQEATDFSDTVQKFIDGAAEKGIQKVIIDLQQNNGGHQKLAFDTFKRFFPRHDVYAGSRRRSHPLGTILGQTMTEWWSNLNEEHDEYWEIAGNEWVVPPRIDAETGRNFESWAEFDAYDEIHGDKFSKVERYNISDNVFVYAAFGGYAPYGYGRNPVVSEVEVFKPENIVILTDGLCSSACSIFVEAMTRMSGVRTIALGGLPQEGPMQAVSGSRGARAYTAVSIDDIMAFVGNHTTNETAKQLLPIIPPGNKRRDTGIRTSFLGINLRDQVRSDPDQNQVPLQFQYLAADCRLFYTLTNIYNLTQLWTDVANAAFSSSSSSACVPGSTGYTHSSTDSQQPPLSPPPIPPSVYTNLPTRPTYNSTELESYTGPPPYDDGDILAKHRSETETELIPCSTNTGSAGTAIDTCGGGYICGELKIKCPPGKKPKRGIETTTQQFCLWECFSANDNNCRKYSDELRELKAQFYCDGFATVNSKALGRDGRKKDERDRFRGVCVADGIVQAGSCV